MITDFLKKNVVILSVLFALILTITILSLVIKHKNEVIKYQKDSRDSLNSIINVSNGQIMQLLDANEYLKLEALRKIASKDSEIVIIKNKLHNAKDFYNPNVISDDDVTKFISGNIYNQ